MKRTKELKKIRIALLFFIVALFLSGATAIPIDSELQFLLNHTPANTYLQDWLSKVLSAYTLTKQQYSFLLYGYDWLAFAHFVLAILFIGPYKNPVRNIWVIEFGLIACLLVIPFAFIAGHFRGIPVGWRLIDYSFGVFGFALLWYCYSRLKLIFPSISKNQLHHETS
jgi:hypothetical protein